ncbi:MAG: CDP-alcohol phosphatidyltransferase family protein [Owenweeksia sp.]|nr:CDP-alcohol phosphatidyltransferase family protein [Owenweeksia sp.]
MGSIRNFLPNAITLANLACGLYGILSVLQGHYQLAAIMVCGSLLFDFMDGLVARALGVSSDIGLQARFTGRCGSLA